MSEQTASAALEEQAGQLRAIYDNFTQSVQDLGSKAKGRSGGSKLGNSLLHWIGGGHVRTDRDRLCEEFLEQVEGRLTLFQAALEEAPPEEAARACGLVADVMLEPVSVRSNSTTDLMKRAMVSRFEPFLPYLTREKVRRCYERMKAAYKPREMLPVEKTLFQKLERLVQN